jgi:flagellar biosynthesis/type III secretory pathway protein FliH
MSVASAIAAIGAGEQGATIMKNLKSFSFALALSALSVGVFTGMEPTGLASSSVAEAHAMGPQADLRLALNQLLSEHATLAAAATNAALGGRSKEFKAAADALDGNSQDIAKAIGSVYGEAAGEAFLPLWRKHIGFFVDYTTAKAKGSKKGQEKAVNDLVQYAQDFGAFLNSATPSLPKEAVAELVKMHILSLKDVVDAQAKKDQKLAYVKIREAAHHMQMIADPLADAIIKQFPEKFPAQ